MINPLRSRSTCAANSVFTSTPKSVIKPLPHDQPLLHFSATDHSPCHYVINRGLCLATHHQKLRFRKLQRRRRRRASEATCPRRPHRRRTNHPPRQQKPPPRPPPGRPRPHRSIQRHSFRTTRPDTARHQHNATPTANPLTRHGNGKILESPMTRRAPRKAKKGAVEIADIFEPAIVSDVDHLGIAFE